MYQNHNNNYQGGGGYNNYNNNSQNNGEKKVFCNFFRLQFNPNLSIYTYYLDVKPMPTDYSDDVFKLILKSVRQFLKENLKSYFENSKIIYSPTKVDSFACGKQVIQDTQYEITVVSKHRLPLNEQTPELTNLLGRLFKIMNRQIKLQPIGRRYFDPSKKQQFNEFQLEVLPGYQSSINNYGNKLLINIDSCFKVIRGESMLDIIRDLYNKGPDFLKDLVGQSVMTKYNGKFYRINEIDFNVKANSVFKQKNGKEISYCEYYQQKYKFFIKDPGQPMIKVIEKNGKMKIEQTIYLVPEFCQPTGLTDAQRNNFQLMKSLATTTKPKSTVRIKQSQDYIDALTKDSQDVMKQWNVQVDREPVQVNIKMLNPGNLVMENQKRQIEILKNNLDRTTQTQMFEQQSLSKWAVVAEDRDKKCVQDFLQIIQKTVGNFQYPCQQPKEIQIQNGRDEYNWIKVLQTFPKDVLLVVLILPGRKGNGMHYEALKRYLTKECPIPSQVILTSTIQQSMQGGEGKLLTICNKLIVQINAKLGGIPWAIDSLPFTDKPTMLIGIDVYHETKLGKNSFLGFVATVDRHFCKYFSKVAMHTVGQEIATHLNQTMKMALQEFQKSNGVYPSQVIIYRDGVSTSQQSAIKELEGKSIKDALLQTPGCEQTLLSVICVNKKVNARFYVSFKNSNMADNPDQGTLIDQTVTSGMHDFYIISQRTTQGTATPTHYHILINEIGDNPETITKFQMLSYKLCYLYYNFTGAIKIPSPVQYAHKLAMFVGDKYNQRNPDNTIIPHAQFLEKRSLFFI